MPLPEVVKGLKLILAMEIMFIVAAGITKLSMLALTYRIMTGSNKELRFLIKLVTVFVLAVLVGFSFADLFQCRFVSLCLFLLYQVNSNRPISDFWFLTFNDQPTCFKDGPLLLAGGILNTITDFLVVTLPIPTVLSLQLPRRQKVIIAVLLSVGFMVTITGAVRAYFTYKSTKTYDRVWALQQAFVCTSVELYVGIVNTLPPLQTVHLLTQPPDLRLRPLTQDVCQTLPTNPTPLYIHRAKQQLRQPSLQQLPALLYCYHRHRPRPPIRL